MNNVTQRDAVRKDQRLNLGRDDIGFAPSEGGKPCRVVDELHQRPARHVLAVVPKKWYSFGLFIGTINVTKDEKKGKTSGNI